MKKQSINNSILLIMLVLMSFFSCCDIPQNIFSTNYALEIQNALNVETSENQTLLEQEEAERYKAFGLSGQNAEGHQDRIYKLPAQAVVIASVQSSVHLEKKATSRNFGLFLAILFKIALFTYFIFHIFRSKEQRLFTLLLRILKFIHHKDGKKREAAFLHV